MSANVSAVHWLCVGRHFTDTSPTLHWHSIDSSLTHLRCFYCYIMSIIFFHHLHYHHHRHHYFHHHHHHHIILMWKSPSYREDLITAIFIITSTLKFKYQRAKQRFRCCQSMIISRYLSYFWLTAAKTQIPTGNCNVGVRVIMKIAVNLRIHNFHLVITWPSSKVGEGATSLVSSPRKVRNLLCTHVLKLEFSCLFALFLCFPIKGGSGGGGGAQWGCTPSLSWLTSFAPTKSFMTSNLSPSLPQLESCKILPSPPPP